MEITEIRRNPLPPSIPMEAFDDWRWICRPQATYTPPRPFCQGPWPRGCHAHLCIYLCTYIVVVLWLYNVCTLYDTYARVSNGNLNGGRTDEGDVVKQWAKWWEKIGTIKFFQKFNCFAILSNYARNAYYLGTFPNFFCRNHNKYAYYLWFF